MTLEELKTRCEAQGFSYAYGEFKDYTDPPYLVAYANSSTNFIADTVVYKKITTIQLDYVFSNKDINEQNKIEDIILSDVAWDKSDETYLEDQNVWQVSYFFEIIGGGKEWERYYMV